MIITKEILVKIKNKKQIEHFYNLGYVVSYGDEIKVKPEELSKYSTYRIVLVWKIMVNGI